MGSRGRFEVAIPTNAKWAAWAWACMSLTLIWAIPNLAWLVEHSRVHPHPLTGPDGAYVPDIKVVTGNGDVDFALMVLRVLAINALVSAVVFGAIAAAGHDRFRLLRAAMIVALAFLGAVLAVTAEHLPGWLFAAGVCAVLVGIAGCVTVRSTVSPELSPMQAAA